jgi:serine/threonine-protein kinase
VKAQLARPLAALGRYRIVAKIGAGGMAEVYRATVDGTEGFSRDVVVKRILPALADDPAVVQMLADEARISVLLDHPNIVRVHEFCAVDDERFLVMELVEGWDVRSILQRSHTSGIPVPLEVACFVIAEVADALAYAHTLRGDDGIPLEIVHRDVSTSNIRVTRSGTVKLLDFGIAKALGAVREYKTRTGTLKGNLRYMSPEQADGLPLDLRSDVFSLGVVFHELLTSRRLFNADSELGTLRMVREAAVRPPSEQRPEVGSEIDRIVLGMLARDPRDRYPDCATVAAELGTIVRTLGGDASTARAYVHSLPPEDDIGDAPTIVEAPMVPSSNPDARPTQGTSPYDAARARRARRRTVGLAVLAALAIGSAAMSRYLLQRPATAGSSTHIPTVESLPEPTAPVPSASPTPPTVASPTPPAPGQAAPASAQAAAPEPAAPTVKKKRRARESDKPRFNAW